MPAEPGPQDRPKIHADRGWNQLMHALAFKVPRRLGRIAQSRRNLATIRRTVKL